MCRRFVASGSRAWSYRRWCRVVAAACIVALQARGHRGELSLYSLPLVCPPWPPALCARSLRGEEAPCTVAQRLRFGMCLPPPPMGRHTRCTRAVDVLAVGRPRNPCPPVRPGKQSGCRVCSGGGALPCCAALCRLRRAVWSCVGRLRAGPWAIERSRAAARGAAFRLWTGRTTVGGYSCRA